MQRGFSLVELSIVLVILGLLTGGILGGQALIRAAELRSVTSEYSSYVTAIQTFRDKYFALPGDMNNATKFWGAADSGDGVGVDCTSVSSTSSATCNGNSDGTIPYNSNERYRAWQHLSNAGLITGTFNGVQGPGGTYEHIPGNNCPRTKINNGGVAMATVNHAGDGAHYAYNYGNTFTYGAFNAGEDVSEALFTPAEAWNLETKMDDGMPGQGKIFAINGGVGGFNNVQSCTTSVNSSDYNGQYRLTINGLRCAFFMRF